MHLAQVIVRQVLKIKSRFCVYASYAYGLELAVAGCDLLGGTGQEPPCEISVQMYKMRGER